MSPLFLDAVLDAGAGFLRAVFDLHPHVLGDLVAQRDDAVSQLVQNQGAKKNDAYPNGEDPVLHRSRARLQRQNLRCKEESQQREDEETGGMQIKRNPEDSPYPESCCWLLHISGIAPKLQL